MSTDWQSAVHDLTTLLGLEVAPVGIAFRDEVPSDVAPHPAPMSAPTPDGRSGRAAASCVFWVEAATRSFSTVAEDHGNCSVGRWVHGFAKPEDILDKTDVNALLDSGWVSMAAVGEITTVTHPATSIVYGPLGSPGIEPDVVMLRLTPDQMMQFGEACPSVVYTNKPQCQIVANAKEHGPVTASMGCALSRERTGMSPTELTCAVPAPLVPSILERLRDVTRADAAVRSFASVDG